MKITMDLTNTQIGTMLDALYDGPVADEGGKFVIRIILTEAWKAALTEKALQDEAWGTFDAPVEEDPYVVQPDDLPYLNVRLRYDASNLTWKEAVMLIAFIKEGCSVNGAKSVEGLLEDNMTWMDAVDLQRATGWKSESVGGVMSALQAKGLIEDSGERVNGEPGPSFWYATDEGLKVGFPLYRDHPTASK